MKIPEIPGGNFEDEYLVPFLIPLSRGGGPLFRQVYLGLRQAILSGAVRKGERIPSTRDLSEQLGVSRTVVLMAFDQLMAEGFVTGLSGSGTYVSEGPDLDRPRPPGNAARFRLSRFGRAAREAPWNDGLASKATAPVRYDFAYGRSDVSSFPFAMWRRLLLQRARRTGLKDLDDQHPGGRADLREAIAAHLRRARAVACEWSQVIVVNGSQQGLDLIARILIDRGDTVAMEDPQYKGARAAFLAAGARLRPVSVDHEGLNPAKLPDHARAVFVTPSHQFPTGAILPLGRRLELLAWARRTGAVVVEDDYDGEFRYGGHALESLQGLDGGERVIYLGTFSRTIFSALRIGYLVVPKPLIEVFTAAKWISDRHTATLEQQTLAEFIASGMYERHLRRVRRGNALRRQALLESVERYLGNRVEVTGDGAGAHVVLWPTTGRTEPAIVSAAAERNVGVYGVSEHFLKRPPRPGVLLGYARLNEREIREGILRLRSAF